MLFISFSVQFWMLCINILRNIMEPYGIFYTSNSNEQDSIEMVSKYSQTNENDLENIPKVTMKVLNIRVFGRDFCPLFREQKVRINQIISLRNKIRKRNRAWTKCPSELVEVITL